MLRLHTTPPDDPDDDDDDGLDTDDVDIGDPVGCEDWQDSVAEAEAAADRRYVAGAERLVRDALRG